MQDSFNKRFLRQSVYWAILCCLQWVGVNHLENSLLKVVGLGKATTNSHIQQKYFDSKFQS